MLVLVSTSDKLQAVTTDATTTLDWRSDFIEAPNPITAGATQTPKNEQGTITGATTADICGAPASSTVRNLKRCSISNTHATLPQTVKVQAVNASSTKTIVPSVTLQAGESLSFGDAGVFYVFDINGKLKNTGFTTAAGSASQVQYNDGSGNLAGAAYVEMSSDGNLHLVDNDPGTTPGSGRVKLFGRAAAGRMLPAFMGPSGLDSVLQPMLARNKVGYWDPPGNATTVPGVFGIAAPTAVGTATSRTVATTNMATRMRRLGYASAATAGALCGHYIAAAQFTVGDGGTPNLGGFFLVARFVPSDPAVVSGARGFVGVSSSAAVPTNVEPSAITNCVGVAQLSSSTNMQIVYGGSAAQTPIDLGSSFPFSTASVDAYELALFFAPTGSISYSVMRLNTGDIAEGTLTGVAGTALPASTTLLAYRAWRCNNATALACGIDICSVYIETDQ